jgi:hypothetical protein
VSAPWAFPDAASPVAQDVASRNSTRRYGTLTLSLSRGERGGWGVFFAPPGAYQEQFTTSTVRVTSGAEFPPLSVTS